MPRRRVKNWQSKPRGNNWAHTAASAGAILGDAYAKGFSTDTAYPQANFVALRAANRASRSRTQTTTGTKRKGSMGSAYGLSRSYARKRTRLSRQTVRPKALIPFVIDRLQGVKQEVPDKDPETGFFHPGNFLISKGISAGAGGFDLPCYLFELTHVNNTAAAVAGAAYQAKINDFGQPTFNAVNTQSFDGTAVTSTYVVENASNIRGNGIYNHHIQHAYYDIRLKLYGARKQAVTYDVFLMKFNHSALIPDQTSSDSSWLTRRVQFWQSIAKQYTVNSIIPGQFGWQKYVQVIKRKRIALPASSSDDLDRNPASVDLKWFVKDMRMLDYRIAVTTEATDVAVDSVQWPQTLNTSYSNQPATRDRLFVMVCATDMTTYYGGEDADDSPSFDMLIRRKSFLYNVA